jgi:C-terminal processing protease CtpA/Prc
MEKLSDQSVLVMPIGRLITPDGADILAQGIAPDEVVADTDTPVVHDRAAAQSDRLFRIAALEMVALLATPRL